MAQNPPYGVELLDTTTAGGVLAVQSTQDQPITSIAILSMPAGAEIEISLGKGGSAIPISGPISYSWSDCEQPMTGGIFYRVTTAAAGVVVLHWAARSGAFQAL